MAGEVGRAATWLYLFIAFVVLPPYVPFAVAQIEPTLRRRRLMIPFLAIGLGVATALLLAMLRGPVSAHLEPYHLAYDIGLPYGALIVTAYVIGTCGSLLLSGYRHIVWFGLVNLPVIAVLALLTRSGFASLWCAWAAITSGMIAVHLRHRSRHTTRDAFSVGVPAISQRRRLGVAALAHRRVDRPLRLRWWRGCGARQRCRDVGVDVDADIDDIVSLGAR